MRSVCAKLKADPGRLRLGVLLSTILLLMLGGQQTNSQMAPPPPIPVVVKTDPEPFHFERAAIVPGVTTRDTVVAMLGQPPISRQNGALIVYGSGAIRKGWVIWPYQQPNVEHYYFVVELNEHQIVRRAEVISGENCTSWNLCIVHADWSEPHQDTLHPVQWVQFGDTTSLLLATPEQEPAARNESAEPAHCAVFVYAKPENAKPSKVAISYRSSNANVQVWVADTLPRLISEGVFVRRSVDEGTFQVEAAYDSSAKKRSAQFPCAGGVAQFIEVEVRGDRRIRRISSVDAESGRAAVALRRLALD